jgi:hypothetical protein
MSRSANACIRAQAPAIAAAFGEPVALAMTAQPWSKASPARVESYRIYRQNFPDALIAIDSPDEATPMPQQPRRRDPLTRAYRSLLSRLR